MTACRPGRRRPSAARAVAGAIAAVSLLATAGGATAGGQGGGLGPPRFFPDDPIAVDHDDLPIRIPEENELSTTYDVLENTLSHHPDGPPPRAVNVNTLGEVPDSSWFTNRIGTRELAIAELVEGAAVTGGPDTTRPLTIIGGKSGGITPGFTLRDANGHVYFVKFDPTGYRNLSTGPDVLVAKFFHAIGYNVPENYVAYFRLEDLVIGEGATVSIPGKGDRPMTERYVEEIVRNAARTSDGRLRAVASLAVPGEPIGPFEFHGVRGDDPNDVFAHEHRRELRGYRVFCAWLNHDDSRGTNTLDTFLRTDGELGHVRHYLIDFSSTLGSGSDARRRIAPQNPRAGNEYVIELAPLLKTAASLGIWERPWRSVTWDHVPSLSEIGRIESDFFRPEAWKPEYPNPAFDRMRPDDAFWAARIVSRFSDEAIHAVVATGRYDSSDGERYLADTLIARRDKTVRHYFSIVNPLSEFRVEGTSIEFDNLGEIAGVGDASGYSGRWHVFDNASTELTPLGEEIDVERPGFEIPVDATADYVMLRIRSLGGPAAWSEAVDVYLRLRPRLEVVGIGREI